MSTKKLWLSALMLAGLGTSLARAEVWHPGADSKDAESAAVSSRAADRVEPAAPRSGELSSWIKYGRPGCCDPIGGDGPIVSELYTRVGPSLPVAGGVLNNTLATGWMFQGGGRSLFFDPSMTSAWTVDLSLGHIVNNGNQLNLNFQLNPGPDNSPRRGNVRTLHRTFVTLGLGREWYLNGAANDFSHYWAMWRFGVDGGARLGTSRMDFNELRTGENFQRTHDVFWSGYLAMHTDVEIPCGGCCIFQAGFRSEWQYDWLDVFPFNPKSNLQSVNLLFTAGVRY